MPSTCHPSSNMASLSPASLWAANCMPIRSSERQDNKLDISPQSCRSSTIMSKSLTKRDIQEIHITKDLNIEFKSFGLPNTLSLCSESHRLN